VTTKTWRQANRPLVLALKLERVVLFATVFLVVVVAGLNLAATSAVLVATEMLYAMFHAWKAHTRGKRGCSRVIVRANSIDSWYLPSCFSSCARIHSQLTKMPRNAPAAMPSASSGVVAPGVAVSGGEIAPWHCLKRRPLPHGRPDKAFLDKWKAKIVEVIDKYDPDFIWFDFGLELVTDSYKKDLLAYYYNRAVKEKKEVVVSYKGHDLPPGAGLLDLEQVIIGGHSAGGRVAIENAT
jgi:hypothetical protein